jgi:tetratricopeptide (TPR) repeat protein
MSGTTVFLCYVREDEAWRQRLQTQLKVLERKGKLEVWDDRRIAAGTDWRAEIEAAIRRARVAVLLVSADLLGAEFIQEVVVPQLRERRRQEGLRIIPVIVRPCVWQQVEWLEPLQVLPRDGAPLSGVSEHQVETVLAELAVEIGEMVAAPAPRSEPTGPRRVTISRLPSTGRDLFGREKELARLDHAWAEASTHVVSLVAWGGVGKTALVNEWLRRLAKDGYRGAEQVYAWSFYSQGTSEEGAASADELFENALDWIGDEDPTRGSPWAKGERLARLVSASPTLLLLDGLEPLQYPPGELEGRLRDQAMQALLKELAGHGNGLCLITTRLPLTELDHFQERGAMRIGLEHLAPADGAELLRSLGVQGLAAELEQAAKEFGGHALALTLLGRYLHDVFDGDIRCRNEVAALEHETRDGGHARRVMSSYERWLGEGPELAVLRLLGLFDRPASAGAIAALRDAPAIPGLTDDLQGLDEQRWKQALAKLRRARLLAAEDPHRPGSLDAHPLVREHFGEQLQQDRPDAWRQAHSRLYEHLEQSERDLPETLEEMAPLFAAVSHGCRAGRHQEALDEVYWKRISRQNQFFSTKKLGAFGADLAALSGFFDPPWRRPVDGISQADQSFVLSLAGFRLRALGRLSDAAVPMAAALQARIDEEVWDSAAANAGNLSELHLTLGEIGKALRHARQSVELADRSGDEFQRMSKRTALADALHQAGHLDEAGQAFRKAEEMQAQQQPEYPLLYSLRGFQYCDLLLGQGRYREVLDRVELTLKWVETHGSLLDVALDHLSLGRARLLLAAQDGTGALTRPPNTWIRRWTGSVRPEHSTICRADSLHGPSCIAIKVGSPIPAPISKKRWRSPPAAACVCTRPTATSAMHAITSPPEIATPPATASRRRGS